MEIQRPICYQTRGRAQVAISSTTILTGQTLDISVGEVCILLDDKIPINALYPIRFEMTVNGKIEIITALAKSNYGVFANHGGFRVGFKFSENDQNRTKLIQKLATERPIVDQHGAKDSMHIPIETTDF